MLLQTLLQGQTLDEIKDGLIEACDRLTALDAFSSVDVLADKSAEVRLLGAASTFAADAGARICAGYSERGRGCGDCDGEAYAVAAHGHLCPGARRFANPTLSLAAPCLCAA